MDAMAATFEQPGSEGLTPFLANMWNMMHDPAIHHIIRWSDDGLSFHVADKQKFENSVLPQYFKHRKFTSFVRQVNMYEFKKIGDPHAWQWRHKHFRKGQPELLKLIQRKATDNEKSAVKFPQEHLSHINGELEDMKASSTRQQQKIAELEATTQVSIPLACVCD